MCRAPVCKKVSRGNCLPTGTTTDGFPTLGPRFSFFGRTDSVDDCEPSNDGCHEFYMLADDNREYATFLRTFDPVRTIGPHVVCEDRNWLRANFTDEEMTKYRAMFNGNGIVKVPKVFQADIAEALHANLMSPKHSRFWWASFFNDIDDVRSPPLSHPIVPYPRVRLSYCDLTHQDTAHAAGRDVPAVN